MANLRNRDGKWQAQVRRSGHKLRTKSFLLKADAQRWARQMEAELDRAAIPNDTRRLDSCSIAEVINRYKAEVTPKKRGTASELKRIEVFPSREVDGSTAIEGHASDFQRLPTSGSSRYSREPCCANLACLERSLRPRALSRRSGGAGKLCRHARRGRPRISPDPGRFLSGPGHCGACIGQPRPHRSPRRYRGRPDSVLRRPHPSSLHGGRSPRRALSPCCAPAALSRLRSNIFQLSDYNIIAIHIQELC